MIALPARLVTPRFTTAEAHARVLSDAARGQPARNLVSHVTFDAREPGARIANWRVAFTYADGTTQVR